MPQVISIKTFIQVNVLLPQIISIKTFIQVNVLFPQIISIKTFIQVNVLLFYFCPFFKHTSGLHKKNLSNQLSNSSTYKKNSTVFLTKTTQRRNNKHNWTPTKYLNVLHHNRAHKQLQYFFLYILQKITNFKFWILWICQLLEILMFICMQN